MGNKNTKNHSNNRGLLSKEIPNLNNSPENYVYLFADQDHHIHQFNPYTLKVAPYHIEVNLKSDFSLLW